MGVKGGRDEEYEHHFDGTSLKFIQILWWLITPAWTRNTYQINSPFSGYSDETRAKILEIVDNLSSLPNSVNLLVNNWISVKNPVVWSAKCAHNREYLYVLLDLRGFKE